MTRASTVRIAVALIGVAITLRIILGLGSPTPFGYVYDFYHEPFVLLHKTGELPKPDDCWQCYQPPLFTLVGNVVYSAGMAATGGNKDAALQVVASFTVLVSLLYLGLVFLIVRYFVKEVRYLAALSAFLVTLPCVFLSSYAVEADIFCATLMLGAFYLYLRYANVDAGRESDAEKEQDGSPWQSVGVVLGMGLLAGLAALTKYSGLVIIAVLAALLGLDLLLRSRGRDHWRRRLAHLGLFLAVAVGVGAAPYVANLRERGEFITGNRAWKQWHGEDRVRHFDRYEFDTFQLGRLVDLMEPDAKPGELKRFSVYNKSVFSSLYGQIYTDCSVFSNPTRHGLRRGLYPAKEIPVALVSVLLVAGLVPVLLGLAGLVAALARPREHLPFLVLPIAFLGIYTSWFLSYPEWMLKTKYLFCLVPFGLVLCGRGFTLARRAHPRLEQFLLAWIWFVAALSTTYALFFALT